MITTNLSTNYALLVENSNETFKYNYTDNDTENILFRHN